MVKAVAEACADVVKAVAVACADVVKAVAVACADVGQWLARVQAAGTQWDTSLEEQLCYEIKTFLLAGHETSAAMLTWSTYELIQGNGARELVVQEATEVRSGHSVPAAAAAVCRGPSCAPSSSSCAGLCASLLLMHSCMQEVVLQS
jgi:cytochrome P450